MNRRLPLSFISFLLALTAWLSWPASAAERGASSVYLEDMTWTELRDAVAAGHRTAIVPVGGTEQSGPHIALGKHNVRAHVLAGRIATQLGNAVVAPVVSYVPEGDVAGNAGHIRFPGTISVPPDAFRAVIEGAARSLKRAGFTDIVLIGDHGGYQSDLATVATRLNREWAGTPAKAHFIADYYEAATRSYGEILRGKGLTPAQIGIHAGTADTSLMLAVDPRLVRGDRMAEAPTANDGTQGDPRPSTAALGQAGADLIVGRTIEAIRRAVPR